MNPHVLVLSSLYDFSTDLVVWQLQQERIPYVRLNRELFAEYRLTLNPLVPELTIDGPTGLYKIDSKLRTVFFRQPVYLRNTPSAPLSLEEQLEQSQWMAFLRAISVFRDAHWMNFPAATYLAESKPYQLLVAKECGFRVPSTLISNDVNRILKEFSGKFAVKSLDTVMLRDGNENLFTYTNVNTHNELKDENVKHTPLIAQAALENKIDIRVTVINDLVFAVRILSKGSGIDGDWRILEKSELEYQDFELPQAIKNLCINLTKTLGLSYSAIDLIENSSGIFFIEINPTGEWGWLSTERRPINRAIATWLNNPS